VQKVSRELLRMVEAAGFVTSLIDMLRAWDSPSLSSAFKDLLNAAKPEDLTSSAPSPALVCAVNNGLVYYISTKLAIQRC